MYDYGARMYMPELGRWGTSDRKGELYLSKSPYSYANNTPVNAIDPDGNLVIFINGQHGGDGGKADYWRQYERKLRFNSNLSGGVTYRKEEVLAFDKAVMEQLAIIMLYIEMVHLEAGIILYLQKEMLTHLLQIELTVDIHKG